MSDESTKNESETPTDETDVNETASEEAVAEEAPAAAPLNLPPADFSILLGMLSTQAMVAVGAIPNPATGKADVQLDLAQHFIGLIAVLEEKTKGNLSSDENAMLDSTLHHLRLMFLEQSKEDPDSAAANG
jgi:hypothetical protein